MKNKILLFAATFMVGATLHAEILNTNAGSNKVENFVVAKDGVVNVGTPVNVTDIGAGMRYKNYLINIAVYVLEVYTNAPETFDRQNAADKKNMTALASLGKSSTVAVRLNFVHDVPNEKYLGAFNDALDTNKVDTSDASVAAFLAAVEKEGDIPENTAVTIVFQKTSDGTETVTYQSHTGAPTTVTGAAGLNAKILSMWFGVPADKQLADLKATVIKGFNP